MKIPKKILDLIREEQIRQGGNFISNEIEYLEKLASKAELVSHEASGECLGFVFFYCNDSLSYSSYITLIMVSQASRNSGIGTALVRYVLSLTAQRGFKACRLEVWKDNIKAINLYKSMGFIELEDRGDKYLLEAQAI